MLLSLPVFFGLLVPPPSLTVRTLPTGGGAKVDATERNLDEAALDSFCSKNNIAAWFATSAKTGLNVGKSATGLESGLGVFCVLCVCGESMRCLYPCRAGWALRRGSHGLCGQTGAQGVEAECGAGEGDRCCQLGSKTDGGAVRAHHAQLLLGGGNPYCRIYVSETHTSKLQGAGTSRRRVVVLRLSFI